MSIALFNLLKAAGEFKPLDDFDREGFAGAGPEAVKAEAEAGKATNDFCKALEWEPTEVGLILIWDHEEKRLSVIHPEQGNEEMFNIAQI